MPAVVSDASPLIYLQALGHFGFRRAISASVRVPPAVWFEVGECGAQRPEGQALQVGVREGWIQVASPREPDSPDLTLSALGAGERQASPPLGRRQQTQE